METLARQTEEADNSPPPEDPEHYRHVFDQVANLLRLTNDEIAARAYTSRNTITAKRKGSSKVTRNDLFALAAALDVPIEVFFQQTVKDALELVLSLKAFDKESAQFKCTERPLGRFPDAFVHAAN